MLVTTFYFLFWAKTSSADMLNMAGTLFAVYWYYEKREEPGFFNYAVFFMTLAVTSLCKGLTGAIVPLIMIFPDLIQKGQWKKHLRFSFLFAMVPALIVYVLPFWASSYFGGAGYGENGLYLVYRENVLRYFQPFDHKGPLYTYFVFLPIYLLPWAFFFIPALFGLKTRWSTMPQNLKSVCWGLLLLFIFFTVSGSRRNYYVLPLVPFAILMTANWILSGADALAKRYVWAGRTALSFLVIMFLAFDVVQPLYYAEGGMTGFAAQLKTAVSETRPWSDWLFVMLDPESKTRFYLGLPPTVKNYAIQGKRDTQTAQSLTEAWPVLRESTTNTIYITRKLYEPVLRQLLPNYRVVEATATLGERLLHKQNPNAPVAFVPVSAS
jgi:4-amino-4-deoxy-L-arabinose transferase-like glycosyltransferase